MLSTERTILRPFTKADIEPFAEICADPRVMKYIGDGTPDNTEVTGKKVRQWMKNYERDGYSLLALIHKEDNILIGFCGLINQNIDGRKYIELGYRLAYDYWGKGLATEAAIAIRDHAFYELGIDSLVSIIHQENTSSMRVAEKFGSKPYKNMIFNNVPIILHRIKRPTTLKPN